MKIPGKFRCVAKHNSLNPIIITQMFKSILSLNSCILKNNPEHQVLFCNQIEVFFKKLIYYCYRCIFSLLVEAGKCLRCCFMTLCLSLG